MNFNFGEVLTRAWQIIWKQKVLWIVGLLFGLVVSLMIPLLFSPVVFPFFLQSSRTDWILPFLAILFIAFSLYILVLYPASVLPQTSLTLGILEVDREDGQLLASELLKRSLPFFWRVLGLMLLFASSMTLIILIIQAAVVLLSVLTFGIAMFCMTPFMLLMYPALYAAIVWMEQAMNGIILDNMTVMEAIRHGWSLIRNNLLSLTVMALVIYLGIGLITGILMVPMMIPSFLVPFGIVEEQVNWTLLSTSFLGTLVFIPLFAVLIGWSMIFTKSTWVLTYLRLTRGQKLQSLSQETTS